MANPKVPPQNTDAEKNIIGGVLIDPESLLKVADKLTERDFYDPRHRAIFSAVMALYKANQPIDIVTLSTYLKKHKLISKSGGSAYISDIVADTTTAANLEEYAEIIKEASTRRGLISLSTSIEELARKEDTPLIDVLNLVESDVFTISKEGVKSDFTHVKDLLAESFEKTDELTAKPGEIRGIRTGFKRLDTLLGGMNRSDLVIVAARPSVGKSALAIDIARHAAVHEGASVGLFSLEMSNIQVMDRVLAMELRTSLFGLRTGKVSDAVFSRFSIAADKIANSNFFIDDTPGVTIVDIRTKARKLKMEHGLDMLIIDYLQLIQGMRKENRVQEVSDISRNLKILARELEIPVIALAQLSRAIEQRVDKRPQLSDLRESGSIEQDADIVMFLQRENMFDEDPQEKNKGNLYIAKHRNGPTGNIELVFIEKQARYREVG